jgi:L-fuculose-phosphate aldolase
MTTPSREEHALREAVVAAARAMNAQARNPGRAGNVSARWRDGSFDGFLVTASGMAYDAMGPGDIVALHADGRVRDARGPAPSSEWRFHRAIYGSRSDVGAIVHSHSMFATTLACLGKAIPAFHYMVARAGGSDIRCAPYARFGSEELAAVAVDALHDRKACLLARHGMITVGETLDGAFDLALEVESLAEMYWRALQVGTPPIIDDAEMAGVLERFRSYGQQP